MRLKPGHLLVQYQVFGIKPSEAAKTVRGMKWARIAELEMVLEGEKISEYLATTRIYFDIKR